MKQILLTIIHRFTIGVVDTDVHVLRQSWLINKLSFIHCWIKRKYCKLEIIYMFIRCLLKLCQAKTKNKDDVDNNMTLIKKKHTGKLN